MSDARGRVREVRFTPRFDRSYRRKTKALRDAVDRAVVQLYTEPTYPSLRVKRIRGAAGEIWEASVDMARRITFEYSRDGTAIIFRNCNGHETLTRP